MAPKRVTRAIAPSRLELWVITLIAFVPAALYFWYGAHNELGADPVNVFERWLGLWTIRFLVVTLLISPLRDLGLINLIRYRRTFGLLTFWYALMHVTTYVVLDQHLNLPVLLGDFTKRPFLIFGLAAFLILVPLAITSNRFSMRSLGRRWGQLHRAIYVVGVLGAIHFLMAFKTYNVSSVGYSAALAVLLVWRLRALRPRKKAARA